MGEIREVDAITDAIIATEREIAGEAWGQEDTDLLDETGDRTLESMGAGLEGQHEAEDDESADGSEEQEGEEESEADGEGEGDAEETAEGNEGEGGEPQQRQQGQQQEQRREPPPGKYREIAERARAAEAERDQLRAQIEAAAKGENPEIAALKAQLTTLTQLVQGGRAPQQRAEPEPPKPAVVPDIFENPTGFAEHLQKGFDTKLDTVLNTVRQNNVSMSFELAHVRHGEAFPKAMEAINKLDATNPQDRQIVQGIYNSPNPGEALVRWHRNREAMSRVGNDPDAYEARIRTETRDALLKDPDFIKQVVATLRGDAHTGDNGSPRTENRLPPSLKRANGASTRGERVDHSAFDGSDQSVADAAWR